MSRFPSSLLNWIGSSVTTVFVTLGSAVSNADGERFDFNIQASDVSGALQQLAEKTQSEIVFASSVVKEKYTAGVQGIYTERQALEILLADTDLVVNKTPGNVLLVQVDTSKKNPIKRGRPIDSVGQGEVSRSGAGLEEVVVTANKREQRLQEVPMSITALGVEEIERKGLVSLSDYLNTVPSVNFLEQGVGFNQIVIRGIAVEPREQATVSSYLGEVPLTSPIAGGGATTDIKLVDIERVEVLRGPQGTLYGSGAMGGTIRYIPNAPELDQLTGSLDLGYSATAGSDDSGIKAVGVVNLPLIDDRLAMRAVAYRYDNSGFIDMQTTPELVETASLTGTTVNTSDDQGGHTYTGGRVSWFWQASDQLEVTAAWVTQKLEQDGRSELHLPQGGYRFTGLNGPVFLEDDFDLANLVIEYDFGWGQITSSSSAYDGSAISSDDLANIVGLNWAAVQERRNDKEGIVQEIRFATQVRGPLQFVGGVYYEDADVDQLVRLNWYGSAASGEANGFGVSGTRISIPTNQTLTQRAIFGEFSYSFSQAWIATVGGRWFDYDRRDISERFDTNGNPIPGTSSDVSTDETGQNFKVNLSYQPQEDVHLYAQWAEGFRIGSGQVLPDPSICDVNNDGRLDHTDAVLDPEIDSDSIDNYELGGKFSFLDEKVRLSAALFRTDWTDIPVRVEDTTELCENVERITVNAGEARSEGVEFETVFYPTESFHVSLAASYVETKFLDDRINQKGERLPLSPRFNGNLGVEYNFEVAGYRAFVRSDLSYIGSFNTDLAGVHREAGNYEKWNLRAGVEMNQFTLEAYANNILNEDAITNSATADLVYRLQPRIIGLDIGYVF